MSNPILEPDILNFFDRAGFDPKSAVAQQVADRCAKERKFKLGTSFWSQFTEEILELRTIICSQYPNGGWQVNQGRVCTTQNFDKSLQQKIDSITQFLHPWRKGPFTLGSLNIEAEWQSDLKWKRLSSSLPDLSKKVVLDCGCNNGYYLYRIAESQPKALLGIDPNDRFNFQFEFVRTLTSFKDAQFELLGVEDVEIFPQIFDAIFCLGVIYHRRDPLGMLATLKKAIKPNGFAVIESITLPGKLGDVTYIADRYSQMRNVFFLPSSETLAAWMVRVGFKQVSIIDQTTTSVTEQRKTKFAWFDSLSDFLDPDDPTKTKEGYLAPARTTVIGYV